jgi:hypothetical protein
MVTAVVSANSMVAQAVHAMGDLAELLCCYLRRTNPCHRGLAAKPNQTVDSIFSDGCSHCAPSLSFEDGKRF